ncbi:putative ATP-grasp-modified RiPP [Amycolatopsis sp. NPDC024027]|uniref:putative ATP-grasp-modified RiPP n=1 Tax=Amycolatopsis sp. NPDC024027 TaxID=3154327 RepID=UPI0033D3A5BD
MDIAFDLTPDANPLAPAGTQFALAGATFTERRDDVASPVGVRPFGLRRATPAGPGVTLPAWRYDPETQKAVDATGQPLIDLPWMGPPTANTTSSVDGEDGPSAEDWNND